MTKENVTVSLVAYIAAIVIFLLAAFGVTVGDVTQLEMGLFGLAAFALGHILP